MQFERPVPGQSLTTTPKSAPYERPPEITDPIEALDYHLDKLDDVDSIQQAMFLLELGIDIVTLTEGILRGGVLEGIHSVDVSLIIAPILHEHIKGYADAMDIQYKEGFELDDDEDSSYGQNIMLARKVLSERKKEVDEDIVEEIKNRPEEEKLEEPMMVEQKETPDVSKGLMARV